MHHPELVEECGFEDLHENLDRVGCAVRFAAFRTGDADGTDASVHRLAALKALERERDRTDRHFAELLQRPQFAGKRRSEFFVMTIHEDLLGPGDRVCVEDFVGPGCDLSRRRVLLKGTTPNHLNHQFWSGDDENFRNVVQIDMGKSFARAFLNPPYFLIRRGDGKCRSLTHAEAHRIFFETVDRLFGGLPGNCIIFRWSADSSNYFDAGKEWWGTYFFTVFVPEFSRIVGIIASATD